MGTRQPAPPAFQPAYGLPGAVTASEEASPRGPSGAIPLLVLVVVLAVAAAWFVGRPMLERSSQPQRTCEVIVLASGTTKCVQKPASAPAVTHAKSTRPAKS